jgi:hypothetical protein
LATVTVKASDLTGTQGPDETFGRLVVKGHPAVEGARVLDVLPDEVAGLKTVDDLIELEYTEPGATTPKPLVVRRADFDKLAPNMPEVLEKAPQRPGRRSR